MAATAHNDSDFHQLREKLRYRSRLRDSHSELLPQLAARSPQRWKGRETIRNAYNTTATRHRRFPEEVDVSGQSSYMNKSLDTLGLWPLNTYYYKLCHLIYLPFDEAVDKTPAMQVICFYYADVARHRE